MPGRDLEEEGMKDNYIQEGKYSFLRIEADKDADVTLTLNPGEVLDLV